VLLLEARERLGGRIFTQYANGYPVELERSLSMGVRRKFWGLPLKMDYRLPSCNGMSCAGKTDNGSMPLKPCQPWIACSSK